jgi:hypothetical protein
MKSPAEVSLDTKTSVPCVAGEAEFFRGKSAELELICQLASDQRTTESRRFSTVHNFILKHPNASIMLSI